MQTYLTTILKLISVAAVVLLSGPATAGLFEEAKINLEQRKYPEAFQQLLALAKMYEDYLVEPDDLRRLDRLKAMGTQLLYVMNAQVALGVMCESGTGTAQDYAEAAKWYQRAADEGAPEAQAT